MIRARAAVARSRPARRALAGLAVWIALVTVSGCRREPPRAPAPVVLVTIDTLRSDHLPAYGYEGVATPGLDALRRDSVLAARAYSHAPLTLPSHASLLTGLLPTVHGVRDNSGYRLGPGYTTLATLLGETGYATGAAVSAYVVRAGTGLATGFDHYDDGVELGGGESLAEQQRSGRDTLAAVLPWLRQAAAGPFLLWLHLYEPHAPYDPPEPWRSRFASPYDGEIAAADAVVGELLAELRKLGVYDRALIAVLSDHGEGLGDHGEAEHGVLLYREALQVPLLLKLPGNRRAGETVERPVQLVDLVPTVLAELGVAPPEGLAGRSILADDADAARGAAPIYAETYYPRLHHGWSELRSVVSGRYHYIAGPDPELYDLVADPAERSDLAAAEPRVAAALREAVAALEVEPAAPASEDEQTRRRLAALGYLSSARSRAGAPGSGADPKSGLGSLRALDDARRLFAAGDAAGTRERLERLVAAEPGMVDAWETLADVEESSGRWEQALAARRRAIEASGGAAEQALKAASLLFRLGRAEEAAEHARVAVEAFPETAYALLARIAMVEGDLERAETEARAAVAARGRAVTPVLTLAEVQAARGDAEGALATVAGIEDELLARALPDPRPFLLRADLLARRGDSEGASGAAATAASEARRLLALHPGSPVGWGALARALELGGDPRGAVTALEQALAADALDDVGRVELALAWSRGGRARDAAALVEPLARRGDPAAVHAWAVALTESGDQTTARAVLEAALAHDSELPELLETLGLVELRAGRPRAATAPLERAAALDAGAANVWNLLGVARWQGGRDAPGAIAAWERSLALDPERWEVLYNLARVALETGDRARARAALERFVAGAPRSRYAGELEQARRDLAGLGPAGS